MNTLNFTVSPGKGLKTQPLPIGGAPTSRNLRQMQEAFFYHNKVHNYGPSTSRFSSKNRAHEIQSQATPATTHMILNFKNKFVDPDDAFGNNNAEDTDDSSHNYKVADGSLKHTGPAVRSDFPHGVDVKESYTLKSGAEVRNKAPPLTATFALPKARPLEEAYVYSSRLDHLDANNRSLVGKIDMETQTDRVLKKKVFVGLSGYQAWNNEVVEPFIKELRMAVKSERPEDISTYITAFCTAYEAGRPVPKTVVVEEST